MASKEEIVSLDANRAPHNFYVQGRPEDLYLLTRAGDVELCSKVIEFLNVPGRHYGQGGTVVTGMGEFYLNSPLSVKWNNLGNLTGGVYQFAKVDLDNDGEQEIVVRATIINRVAIQYLFLADASKSNVFDHSVIRSPRESIVSNPVSEILYSIRSNDLKLEQAIYVDLDTSEEFLPKEVGDFVDVIELHGVAFILAGIEDARSIEQNDGILRLFIIQSTGAIRQLCEFQSRYRHSESRKRE